MQSNFAANEAQIKKLARADTIVLGSSLDVPKASAKAVLSGGAEIAVPLEGLIDFDKERERLQNQICKARYRTATSERPAFESRILRKSAA
jgi:valyl-tRNA synthetase